MVGCPSRRFDCVYRKSSVGFALVSARLPAPEGEKEIILLGELEAALGVASQLASSTVARGIPNVNNRCQLSCLNVTWLFCLTSKLDSAIKQISLCLHCTVAPCILYALQLTCV